MSLTTRELVLLGILAITGIITGFYHLYFQPQINNLAALRAEVVQVESQLSLTQRQAMEAQMALEQVDEGLQEEWEIAMRGIKAYFNISESQRIMQRIVYPHVRRGETISFDISEPSELTEDFSIVSTSLTFTTNRTGLESVVRQLGNIEQANRIIEFSVSSEDPFQGINGPIVVSLTIEFLTEYIEQGE